MEKTFKTFANRKDKDLTGFRAVDETQNDELCRIICSNATTGYVRQLMGKGTPTSVPNHAAAAVEAHLVAHGWTLAE